MLCEQIMNRNVKSLKEKDTAQAAAKIMRDANIGFLPICGAAGKVVGTITDRDIVVRLAADSGALTAPISTLMTKDVIACKPTDDLRRVEELMGTHKKSRLVCIDDQGRPVGVVSLSDIAHHETDFHLSQLMRTITTREVHKA